MHAALATTLVLLLTFSQAHCRSVAPQPAPTLLSPSPVSLATNAAFAAAQSHAAHVSRELFFQYPTFAPGDFLLDQDNGTEIMRGLLGPPAATRMWQYSFDPESEFVVFMLNCSTVRSATQRPVKMDVEYLGAFSGGRRQGADVDFSYLPAEKRLPYQSYAIKPSDSVGICRAISSQGPCNVRVTISLDGPDLITPIPFKLSVLKGRMLPFATYEQSAVERNRVRTYGVEVSESDLDVLFQMESEPSNPQRSDHMLFLLNAANPIQYFVPRPDSKAVQDRPKGDTVAYVMPAAYASKLTKTVRNEEPEGVARRHESVHLAAGDALGPSEGGNALADPNYNSGRFNSALYLMAVLATEDSTDDGGLHRFVMLNYRKYEQVLVTQWNGSTYGIVGALTLLVLCLVSCAVAFMRRRCRGGRSMDDGMFFGSGALVLSQAQRDALPQFDANGRPIRYDAHGRVLPDLGAKKEEIDKLPVRIFQVGMIPAEDATCTVCLGEYEAEEKIMDMPCRHTFHSECLLKWLSQHRTCPCCRCDIAADPATAKQQRQNPPPRSEEVAPLVATPPTSPPGSLQPPAPAWCVEEGKESVASRPGTAVAPSSITLNESQQVARMEEGKEAIELSARPMSASVQTSRTSRNVPATGGGVTVHVQPNGASV